MPTNGARILKLHCFGLTLFAASLAHAAPTGFGMVPYWGSNAATYQGRIPAGAHVVINPNSGALNLSASQISSFKSVIAEIRRQGGKVIGYIPAGYTRSTAAEKLRYNNIPANLSAYQYTLGGVDGYFFDEAAHDAGKGVTDAQKCAGTKQKWSAIRSTMASMGATGTVVWNAGWPGMNQCFVSAAQNREHIVISEVSYGNYASQANYLNGTVQKLARERGVKTWLLLHSTSQNQMKQALRDTAANYVYATNVKYDASKPWGGPLWNTVPSYWGDERKSGSERWCLQRVKNTGSC